MDFLDFAPNWPRSLDSSRYPGELSPSNRPPPAPPDATATFLDRSSAPSRVIPTIATGGLQVSRLNLSKRPCARCDLWSNACSSSCLRGRPSNRWFKVPFGATATPSSSISPPRLLRNVTSISCRLPISTISRSSIFPMRRTSTNLARRFTPLICSDVAATEPVKTHPDDAVQFLQIRLHFFADYPVGVRARPDAFRSRLSCGAGHRLAVLLRGLEAHLCAFADRF